jgi:hypothetical protein
MGFSREIPSPIEHRGISFSGYELGSFTDGTPLTLPSYPLDFSPLKDLCIQLYSPHVAADHLFFSFSTL